MKNRNEALHTMRRCTSYGSKPMNGEKKLIGDQSIARSLLELGTALYACRDRHDMLGAILSQARRFARAEAGSLYLVRGDCLRFVTVQNDRMNPEAIAEHLLGQEMPITADSLVGFAAITGDIINLPNSRRLPAGAPFRINRDLDARTGYEVVSILALPLKYPDGAIAGVMQLFNRRMPGGQIRAFSQRLTNGLVSLAAQAAMALNNLELREQLRDAHMQTILRLSRIAEYRDTDTGEHVKRVSAIAEIVAVAMGLPAKQVELIKYASPMHDVGKVAIPDTVLLKPGRLNDAERAIMQTHTTAGAGIFGEPENELIKAARDVALSHHERWDGGGYPQGLPGPAIPLAARITCLADTFDAIISRRCYKEPQPFDQAMAIVRRERSQQFDPAVVDALLAAGDQVRAIYLHPT